MSVDAIKAELTELGVKTDADSKEALVSELLNARAFSRPMFDPSQFGGDVFGNTGAGTGAQ